MRLTPLLLAAVTGLLTIGAAPATDTVQTRAGVVRGAVDADVRAFRGIPYAHASRWLPPAPVRPWGGVKAASAYGPACPQPTGIPIAPAEQDEDCLTLNVTTPAGRGGKRPVVVYLHGGSFNYGAGANYAPDDLVTRGDLVAVTVNYRLGVLGFLAHPGLGEDAANLGLLDQQAALRWVRDSIAAFGGDPRNATIMGQSAGGASVCAHLVSPASAGLFHRAIVQSAGCAGEFRDRAAARQSALDVAAAAGCADVACLRRKTPAELVAASGAGHDGYRHVGGGRLLPRGPGAAFASGRFNRVPVLFGGNHDEETGALFGQDVNEGNLAEKFAGHFGSDAGAVLAEYPVTAARGPAETLAAALTDRNWALPADDTRRLLARHTPVHAYEFAERDTPWFPGYPRPGFEVGASHMLELPYLFDVRYLTPATQQDLREFMIDSWARFIRTGDPGWQRFQRGGLVLSLASGPDGVRPTDFAADHRLDFWRALVR